ncbi:hypothetical protein FRD01_22705 [Microvenator marinus]|uniref:Uncharacterized protein n=1 Tax=Microvenator marinus TaxID=2600177 RepID=A0A5B8XXT3_9DELT|nr:hypothetical protein [Microvenator marinus]QED29991.1 hypothetical protein FRD01_22705 [Microvenator marinus]
MRGHLSYLTSPNPRFGCAKRYAAVLTTEGFWTCDLRQDSQWTRVAGHPNDPPEGMNPGNKHTFEFKGPLGLGQDGRSYRRGMSRPVKLSADGRFAAASGLNPCSAFLEAAKTRHWP